jgi:hypothetical protein
MPPAGGRGQASPPGTAPCLVCVADKTLEGVTCIRLDASAVDCHSDKELVEPNDSTHEDAGTTYTLGPLRKLAATGRARGHAPQIGQRVIAQPAAARASRSPPARATRRHRAALPRHELHSERNRHPQRATRRQNDLARA